MFPPQIPQQQQPQPMGGAMPPPPMGGASGMQPQGPVQVPTQQAVPPGAIPLSPQQQQIAQVIQNTLSPQELQVVKQSLTPEMMAIVVKLFGTNVSQMLDPLMQVANSNQMMDAGDNIGGVDIEMGGGEMMESNFPNNPMGSVSSPFRGIRA